MSTAIATQNGISRGEIMERVLAAGDLESLSPLQRANYVVKVCESAGLNPLSKPFDLIKLNGKLTLYATKGATDQLRKIHGITLRVVEERRIDDVYQVRVEATDPAGRVDTDIGVVTLGNLKGDALANALMKALTKAKRRVTLSICGLGLLDESEFDTIPRHAFDTPDSPEPPVNAPQAQHSRPAPTPVHAKVVDAETGEIRPTDEQVLEVVRLDTAALAKILKLSAKDVQAYAKTIGANYRTLEGATALRDALDAMVEAQEDQDDDEEDYEGIEAAQGTLIDADTRSIERNVTWD